MKGLIRLAMDMPALEAPQFVARRDALQRA
jgi:hypothetical protein